MILRKILFLHFYKIMDKIKFNNFKKIWIIWEKEENKNKIFSFLDKMNGKYNKIGLMNNFLIDWFKFYIHLIFLMM